MAQYPLPCGRFWAPAAGRLPWRCNTSACRPASRPWMSAPMRWLWPRPMPSGRSCRCAIHPVRMAEPRRWGVRPHREQSALYPPGRSAHGGPAPRTTPSALTSGADGLDDIRAIAAQAPGHLHPGGWLLLEHGWDQAEAVQNPLAPGRFGARQQPPRFGRAVALHGWAVAK